MTRQVVLGVDSSTQSVKVEARDLATGEVVAIGTAPHPPTVPPVSEQDPAAWWDALVVACSKLGDVRDDVVAISVAGQQHGLALLDDTGAAVRPAKLWNDTTSAPEAARLVEALGADTWATMIGSVPVASFTISKLAWVAAHEPTVLDRVARVMLPHDYLTWRLCGEHVTDRGDASGTGWFDPSGDDYVSDLLDAAGVAGDSWTPRLPRVLGPDEQAGVVTPAAADALGIPAGVAVGPGTGDNMGAALGLGLDAGDVAISLGTSGTVFGVSSTATRDASGAVAGFASASGDFLPLVCTLNATKVTDRFAGWLGTNVPGLVELALSAVAAPGDVTVVPYLDGERTPNLPDASGGLVGLTNSTSRAQIALAAHDGVLCGLLDGFDALGAAGASTDGRLFLVGGGSKSAAYRQRLADLSGSAVVVPHSDETVATGGAVQAAVVASGETIGSISDRWSLGDGITVDPANDPADVRARYQSVTALTP